MGAASTKETKHYAAFEASVPTLAGKVVAITGCTSGIGLVTALCAARKGASHIFMLNRDSSRAKEAQQAVQDEVTAAGTKTIVETIACDLQDFKSVRAAAEAIRSKCTKLDVLCNNAGVMALDDVATSSGYDVQMQTNHLSHFLLTKELYPLLTQSDEARIVQHSSMARKTGGSLQAKYLEKNGGQLGGNSNSMFGGAKWERYHQTKLANSCFTAMLASKLQSSNVANVKAVCAAPGLAQTNLHTTTQANGGGMRGLMWIMYMSQSAKDGSMPLITACFGADVNNGDFYEPKNGLTGLAAQVGFDKNSADTKQQQILWKTSEAACGAFSV